MWHLSKLEYPSALFQFITKQNTYFKLSIVCCSTKLPTLLFDILCRIHKPLAIYPVAGILFVLILVAVCSSNIGRRQYNKNFVKCSQEHFSFRMPEEIKITFNWTNPQFMCKNCSLSMTVKHEINDAADWKCDGSNLNDSVYEK